MYVNSSNNSFTNGQYVVSVSTTAGNIYTGATVVATLSASYNNLTPSGTITFSNQAAGNFMVYDSVLSQWTNIAVSYTHLTLPTKRIV